MSEALQFRISRLNAALSRVGQSLDIDTVLQDVVDGARRLTDAKYGLIATVDDSGNRQELITSGFTSVEEQDLSEWLDGRLLSKLFLKLPEPLEPRDLSHCLRELGPSGERIRVQALQGVAIHHEGTPVGLFFLAEKHQEREFTSGDREVLAEFSSQTAAAIVSARLRRDVQRVRAELKALIAISPVAAVVLDARTGQARAANRATKRLIGRLLSPRPASGEARGILTCRRSDGREITLDQAGLARELRDIKTVRAEEVVLSVAGGRSVATLVNAIPVSSEDGTAGSVVLTLQDLAPLKDLDRDRSAFLGMVSHELRAPLTSIKGSAATVLGAPRVLESAVMLQFFRIIEEQADQLDGLITDLMDGERIETESLLVTPEPAEVASLVDQARQTFQSGGDTHAVQIALPRDLPRVMADIKRIVQVLNNLLSNAARHSPESAPIRIQARQDGVYVAISVTDEGNGVPPHRLQHLFQKYVAFHSRARDSGNGLGLSICRGLVEAHGGDIWAHSRGLGHGTRFTFTLPVVTTSGQTVRDSVGRDSGRSQTGRDAKRILVVDDDPQTLRYLGEALEAAGYRPFLTGDPRELPGLLRNKRPDLVLLDLMLPGADGIELMERVIGLADLPVIFISGYRGDETIAKALEMGAVDYIVKPLSVTELKARIEVALRKEIEPEPFQLLDMSIHYGQRRVTIAGFPVELTATEYELLRTLSAHAGRVLTHDFLLRRVWGDREYADIRVVRAFVKTLRRKLGDDAASPTYIISERGVGYRMPDPT